MRHWPIRRATALLFAALLLRATALRAQGYSVPVVHHPSYSFDHEVGVVVAHGFDGIDRTIAATASKLYYRGNCRRFSTSASIGFSELAGTSSRALNMGGLTTVLLNPCPRPTSAPNPTLRLFTGTGLLLSADADAVSVPVGLSIGHMLPLPVARIEFWIAPRAQFDRDMHDDSRVRGLISAGARFGMGAVAGATITVDCCDDVAAGYGAYLWF